MSSANKALELLSYFSAARPEVGLSQLCRIAGRDKATTYRYLQSLETAGLVEQNPTNRHYRLGPAIMQLAQIREATVPRKAGAQGALTALANATGETAHVSVLSGSTLYSLASCESPMHSTRAILDVTTLPLHATASGLCALAFGASELFDVAVADPECFTPSTPTTADALSQRVAMARDSGFGDADQSFEADIRGISAPVFDHTGQFAGAVAVASVAARFTPSLDHKVRTNLIIASREITRNWGGTLPARIEAAWARSHSQIPALEPSS